MQSEPVYSHRAERELATPVTLLWASAYMSSGRWAPGPRLSSEFTRNTFVTLHLPPLKVSFSPSLIPKVAGEPFPALPAALLD